MPLVMLSWYVCREVTLTLIIQILAIVLIAAIVGLAVLRKYGQHQTQFYKWVRTAFVVSLVLLGGSSVIWLVVQQLMQR